MRCFKALLLAILAAAALAASTADSPVASTGLLRGAAPLAPAKPLATARALAEPAEEPAGGEEEESTLCEWHDDADDDEELSAKRRVANSVLLILTAIIGVSILFEVGKEMLEEAVDEKLEPIVLALFSELTVLGFLALVTFVAVRAGLMKELSIRVCDDDEVLVELFENVHMMLFAFMVVFVLVVVVLTRMARDTEAVWVQAEKDVKDVAHVMERYRRVQAELAEQPLGFFDHVRQEEAREATHRYEFLNLRHRFVYDSRNRLKLPADFRYCDYLTFRLATIFTTIVEVEPKTWLGLELLFCVCWVLMQFPASTPMLVVFALLPFAVMLVLRAILKHLEFVRGQLVSRPPAHDERVVHAIRRKTQLSVQTPLLGEGAGADQPSYDTPLDVVPMDDEHLILPPPAYLSRTVNPVRSAWGRFFLGPPPNRHEALFWFDRQGLHILSHVFTLCILILSIHLALIVFWYARTAPWYVTVLSLLPNYWSATFYGPKIVRRWVVTSSVEMMKDPEAINAALREMRKAKAVKAIAMLDSMRNQMRAFSRPKDDSAAVGGGAGGRPAADPSELDMNNPRVQELVHMFELFDKDNSGAIDADELCDVLRAMGQSDVSKSDAAYIIAEVDNDGTGTISLVEFVESMLHADEQEAKDPHELIKELFDMIDEDGSGTLDEEELWTVMQRLNVGLSRDEVKELFEEADEDNSGEIDVEEFAALITHHQADHH